MTAEQWDLEIGRFKKGSRMGLKKVNDEKLITAADQIARKALENFDIMQEDAILAQALGMLEAQQNELYDRDLSGEANRAGHQAYVETKALEHLMLAKANKLELTGRLPDECKTKATNHHLRGAISVAANEFTGVLDFHFVFQYNKALQKVR